MAVNSKDFRRALDKVEPEYFLKYDMWSVFMDGEKRNIRLTSNKPLENLERFRSALKSPCCSKWRIAGSTTTLLTIALVGPEQDMEITYFIPTLQTNIVSESTRWEIYGLLRDYPRGMADRPRLSDAVAVLLGIVKIRPKDVAR